jgi:hypothetical protein
MSVFCRKNRMKNNINRILSAAVLGAFAIVLLAGCGLAPSPSAVANPTAPEIIGLPADQPTRTPAPAAVHATRTPTAAVTAQDPALAEAEKTVQDYFAALQGGDFDGASALVSEFSLMVAGLTHGDVAAQLNGVSVAGAHWSSLQVKGSSIFNAKTVLVHVVYQVSTKDAKTGKDVETTQDELWPLRLENGKRLYNWNNVIDFKTLDVEEQTTAGLTVKPLQMTRYSDRIRLTLLVQNSTNDPIVLGQSNEILGAFKFGDQVKEAEKVQFIFQRLRTYRDTNLEVKGLFPEYPNSVEIRRWKNLQVAPWFTFNLGS